MIIFDRFFHVDVITYADYGLDLSVKLDPMAPNKIVQFFIFEISRNECVLLLIRAT